MYADDTTLFCDFDNCNEDLMNAELNNVDSWLCFNKLSLLSLNVGNTTYVSFHTAKKQ